jgi:hypothetical protein
MQSKLVRALTAALFAVLLVVQPLWAAAPAGFDPKGPVCAAGMCTFTLDMGNVPGWPGEEFSITVAEDAVTTRPDGSEFVLADDVTLALPVGTLALADAELAVTVDELGHVVALRGSALAPVPTFALFDDLALVTPARVTIGYDRGDVVALSHLALDPARRYLFIDAQAGLTLAMQEMALSAPAGQRATLVFDPAQAAVYLDGQVTLRTNGMMAFVGEMLPENVDATWLPSVLPLVATTHVHGELGRALEPSLAVNGKLALDGGAAGQWLKLETAPLTTEGWAMISPAGVLLAGAAEVAIAPDRLLDSMAQAELFVPFAQPEQVRVEASASLVSPMLGVDESVAGTVAGEPGWVAATAGSAWRELQTAVEQGGDTLGAGYAWLEAGAANGWTATQTQWCATTSWCAEDENPQQVAEARE